VIFASSLMAIWCPAAISKTLAPSEQYLSDEDVVSWASGGHFVAACWSDGIVAVFDTENGKRISRWMVDPKKDGMVRQLLLTTAEPARAAIITDKDALTFYDAGNGQPIVVAQIKTSELQEVLGFSSDGKLFFCTTTAQRLISIDVEKGNLVSSVKLLEGRVSGNTMWMATLVSPDGKNAAVVLSNGVVGLNDKAKTMWNVSVDETRALPNGAACQLPVQSHIVNACAIYDAPQRTLMSVSLVDGKVGWQTKDFELTDVRGVSEDGQALCLEKSGRVTVELPKEQRSVAITAESVETEYRFAIGHKQLLCLPSPQVDHFDEAKNTSYLRRRSNLLKIVETAGGRVLRSIEIKKD